MPESILKRAVFLDLASVSRGDLDLSSLQAAVPEWQWLDDIDPQDIAAVLENVDVVVSNKIMLDATLLQSSQRLKLVCVAATGTNNVDIDSARSLGLPVCNVRGYASASVVQHVFALLLSLTTRLNEYTAVVADGGWSRSRNFCLLDYPIHELQGQTLGIVGLGELGRAVAKVAGAFGMNVVIAKRDAHDKRPGRVGLHEMLARVDVLSLHCPLNDSTRNLMGEQEFSLMKPSAILINTARGEIVNSAALLEALKNHSIMAAGIDVLESEPPPSNHPLLSQSMPNLVVTPHTAWASVESRQRCLDEIALNISSFETGEVRNRVSR